MNNSAHAQYQATEIAIKEAKAKLQALENKATKAIDKADRLKFKHDDEPDATKRAIIKPKYMAAWDDFNRFELLAGKAERELQALQSKAAAIFREALNN